MEILGEFFMELLGGYLIRSLGGLIRFVFGTILYKIGLSEQSFTLRQYIKGVNSGKSDLWGKGFSHNFVNGLIGLIFIIILILILAILIGY